jgi:hypothetical protein
MSIHVMSLDDPAYSIAGCSECDWRSPRLTGELLPSGRARYSRLVAAEAGWTHLSAAGHAEQDDLNVGDVVTVVRAYPYGFIAAGELGVITADNGDGTVHFESFVTNQIHPHLRAERFSTSPNQPALVKA